MVAFAVYIIGLTDCLKHDSIIDFTDYEVNGTLENPTEDGPKKARLNFMKLVIVLWFTYLLNIIFLFSMLLIISCDMKFHLISNSMCTNFLNSIPAHFAL